MTAARRAAMTLTDVDDADDFVELPRVPPVAVHRANGATTFVHFLYAAEPPPHGALEDESDDDDCYDWYTYERAARALARDAGALAALRTAACALARRTARGRSWSRHTTTSRASSRRSGARR